MADYHGFGTTFGERGQRYVYDTLSYDKKIMISEGELLPIYLEEIIPGSIFSVQDSYILKNIPSPYRAVFDDAFLDLNYFFVPKRLLWDHFTEFIGADATPDAYTDPTDYVEPMIDLSDVLDSDVVEDFSILNCLGIPATTGAAIGQVNLAPLAAFALVWNSYFRDENLQDENPFYGIHKALASGSVLQDPAFKGYLTWAYKKGSTSPYARVNKYKDLFTSALPSPQKGGEVRLPLGASAPVQTSPNPSFIPTVGNGLGSEALRLWTKNSNNVAVALSQKDILGVGNSSTAISSGTLDSGSDWTPGYFVYGTNLVANLANASAANISDLEKAVFAMQYLRALAVGGSRYNELLRYVYGTSPRDDTLQRPEFLGTLHKRIGFNQVASTAGTSDDTDTNRPTGALGGYMQAAGDQGIFVRQFKEHGYVIGVASIRIKHSYGQGVPKIFQKKNRFDYFNRFFGRLGLVPVMKSELYAGASGTFGFQESWYENKNHPDEVGAFSNPSLSADLAAFTYADSYGAAQSLSGSFVVEGRSNIDQTLVGSQSVPQFVLGIHHRVKATTQVPIDSMPRGL